VASNWFKPKRYGYGATPVTWQGWALTIGAMAAIFLAAWALIGFDRSSAPNAANVVLFLGLGVVLVAALWVVSRRTTDGEWRWRWGGADEVKVRKDR
jgi:Mn2+/Fe2+ NRAMP family transporter